MALIPCPACGKQIPDQVLACQFCGQEINSATTSPEAPAAMREFSWPLVVVAILVVAGIGYAVVDGMKGSSDAPADAPAPGVAEAPIARPADPGDPMANLPLVEIEDSSILPAGAPPLRVLPKPNYEANDRARMEGLRSQIRQVVMTQEIHYNDNMHYARSVRELRDYTEAPFIRVSIVNATANGYGVHATHDKLPGAACAFFIGNAPAVAPARKMGQLECKEPK